MNKKNKFQTEMDYKTIKDFVSKEAYYRFVEQSYEKKQEFIDWVMKEIGIQK
jgi:hypothetical protein